MERTKVITDLGKLSGDLLVFGGVYSNLQALEVMQEIASQEGISAQNIICTGDIVGYCAQPQQCLQQIKDWGIHNIAGNVEIQLREDSELCGCNFEDGSRCNTFSQTWFPYAKYHVSSEMVPWLETMPDHLTFEYAGKRFAVVHGSSFDTSEFIFRSSPWDVKARNFAALEAEVILAGHCGLPFQDEQNGKSWLNPGVIGMPANDGTTRVWYMVLRETEAGFAFEQRSFDYDFATAARLMRENYLPSEYAHTLETGLWDNCEILPEVETGEMGVALGGNRIEQI